MADPLHTPTAPLVSVLIVNYNSGPCLAACVVALAEQRFRDFEIIIIDNGSIDDSLNGLDQCPLPLKIDKVGQNLGFAAANNRAAAQANGQWLALLNPDTVADPDWLANLMAASQRHRTVDIFASLQWQLTPAGQAELLDGAGDPYHVLGAAWRGGKGRHPRIWPMEGEVFSACGAAMLIRRQLFVDLDGFEERYFCYYEDVDLGFRARLQGARTVLVPAAQVAHIGSASGGAASPFAVEHIVRNRLFTLLRNMPWPLLLPILPVVVILEVFGLLKALLRRQVRPRSHALWQVVKALPWLIQSRGHQQSRRQIKMTRLASSFTWSPITLLRRGIDVRHLTPSPKTDKTTTSTAQAGAVGAVIVSFNPGSEIIDAITALRGQVAHLWVIDNGSDDANLAAIRAQAVRQTGWLTLIENKTNRGLGAAQNQGLAAIINAGLEWALLLDDDSLPDAGMVAAMMAVAATENDGHQIGLLAPRLVDPAGSLNAPLYLQGPFGWVRRRRLKKGETVRGLAFAAASGSLIPVAVLQRIGLMRAAFFIDYIDIDFCLRLQRAGLTMIAVGGARLQHRFGVPAELCAGQRRRQAHSVGRLQTIYTNRVQVWRDYGLRQPGYVVFEGLAVIRDVLRISLWDRDRWAKLQAIWRGLCCVTRRP